MNTTTVLTNDAATIVQDAPDRMNWGAVIAGAVIAAAVTFFLITLGAGIGLALVSPTPGGAKTFLTLGAIYFFAAQAFGFAAGAHVTGRLIGPMAENSREEEFRAGAHGLTVWALAIVVSLGVLALTAMAGGAALTAGMAANPSQSPAANYWSDMLLRPAGDQTPPPPQLNADKAEAGRLLAVDLANGAGFNGENRAELVRLAQKDGGLSREGAIERVNAVQTRMRDSADSARRASAYLSLWTAFALLFGGVVAVAAAITARWQDDRISFGFQRR